jgi:hypothetical protein
MHDHAGYERRLRELELISAAAREFTPDRLSKGTPPWNV